MLRLGPYELVREIAAGGMAEVYLAKVTGIAGFEKYVAVKTIHRDFARRPGFISLLVNEAKLAVQLAHPNIAQTFDLGCVGETYYMAMEYIDGTDVFRLLRATEARGQRMPFEACASIVRDVALALEHAHSRCDDTGRRLDIVHRDVSPENVMISWEGTVKLVDFGVAKATRTVDERDPGGITGKLRYLSPEVAWGAPADGRSDIYSAGIVLYEMLTGRPLFLDDDPADVIAKARQGKLVPPRELRADLPLALERIVLRALAPAREDRYQHADEMASELERFRRAHAPGYTTASLARWIAELCAPPEAAAGLDDVTVRQLTDEEIAHAGAGIIDENSVIQIGDAVVRAFDLATRAAPRFGRFELDAQLGTHVLASVDRATLGDRAVALKRLSPLVSNDPEVQRRFDAELAAAARVHHPNLAELVEFGREQGTCFVASELVDGVPLAGLLSRAGPAPVAVAVAIVGQVLDALAAVQAPHGGVWPRNVLITRGGDLKLTDLGVARLLHGLAPLGIAKLAYTAPEAAGAAPPDLRADVFAVGVIAWELLTGRRLFDATSHHKLVAQLRTLDIAPPSCFAPTCDPSLDVIVMAALARHDQRLPSPAIMRAALEPFADHARSVADVVGWAYAEPGSEPDPPRAAAAAPDHPSQVIEIVSD